MPPQPGILLLLWCGVAATVVARPIARHTPNAGRGRARVMALAADLLVFPLLDAVVFELVGRADLAGGAVLGATHAAVELGFGLMLPGTTPRDVRLRSFLARLLYGIVFAFVYIVPGA